MKCMETRLWRHRAEQRGQNLDQEKERKNREHSYQCNRADHPFDQQIPISSGAGETPVNKTGQVPVLM